MSSAPSDCSDVDFSADAILGVLGVRTHTCVEVNAGPLNLCLSLASEVDFLSGSAAAPNVAPDATSRTTGLSLEKLPRLAS